MLMVEQIKQRLIEALSPTMLEVIDESHLHAGHMGARPSGETHFRVRCVSAAFNDKSRLEQHRLVNAALAHELSTSIHALALELKVCEQS
jgi:BolA family transcriptional regulator, general stress-responsive regulator